MDPSMIWIIPAVPAAICILLLLWWILLTILPVRNHEQTTTSRASSAPVMSAPAPVSAPPPMPAYAAPPPMPAAPAYAPIMPPADGIARMAIISGLPALQEYPLPGNMFLLGRFYAPEQNIQIGMDEKSVSRRHAQFRANPATREFYISDLGSSFGTSLVMPDGMVTRLQPNREERLYNGDIVQFGNGVRARFILPCEARSSVTQL